MYSVNKDVWSNGQVDSKLWLCRELEKIKFDNDQTIYILGGWYGMAGFLLLSRENLPIKYIKSFDIDPMCELYADMMNQNWVYKQWKFKAYTKDCNLLDYSTKPNIIINTSCEHFESMDWFNNIPDGTLVALQSNNLIHDDEYTNNINSIDDMIDQYPMTKLYYDGKLDFVYPDKSFSRFMIIGIK